MDWITLDTFQWPVCESLLHMGRHLSISNLGSLLLIVPDDFDFASMSVAKAAVGARARQGSSLILEARHTILRSNQCTSCRMGLGPSIMLYPPVDVPYPQPPSYPLQVDLEPTNGSTFAVSTGTISP
jgi:hypothetical protein